MFLIKRPYPQGSSQLPRERSQRPSGAIRKAKSFAASASGVAPPTPSPITPAHPASGSNHTPIIPDKQARRGKRAFPLVKCPLKPVQELGTGHRTGRDRAEGRVCQPAVVQMKVNPYLGSMVTQFQTDTLLLPLAVNQGLLVTAILSVLSAKE